MFVDTFKKGLLAMAIVASGCGAAEQAGRIGGQRAKGDHFEDPGSRVGMTWTRLDELTIAVTIANNTDSTIYVPDSISVAQMNTVAAETASAAIAGETTFDLAPCGVYWRDVATGRPECLAHAAEPTGTRCLAPSPARGSMRCVPDASRRAIGAGETVTVSWALAPPDNGDRWELVVTPFCMASGCYGAWLDEDGSCRSPIDGAYPAGCCGCAADPLISEKMALGPKATLGRMQSGDYEMPLWGEVKVSLGNWVDSPTGPIEKVWACTSCDQYPAVTAQAEAVDRETWIIAPADEDAGSTLDLVFEGRCADGSCAEEALHLRITVSGAQQAISACEVADCGLPSSHQVCYQTLAECTLMPGGACQWVPIAQEFFECLADPTLDPCFGVTVMTVDDSGHCIDQTGATVDGLCCAGKQLRSCTDLQGIQAQCLGDPLDPTHEASCADHGMSEVFGASCAAANETCCAYLDAPAGTP